MPWIIVTTITLICSLILSLVLIVRMIWHLYFDSGLFYVIVLPCLLYSAIGVYILIVVWSYMFSEISR